MKQFRLEPLPFKIAYWSILLTLSFLILTISVSFLRDFADKSDQAHIIVQIIKYLLSGDHTLNFIIALAGAAAGTWGAQHVIESNKNKDLLLSELRTTNAASIISFNILNSIMILKKKHLFTMQKQHLRNKEIIATAFTLSPIREKITIDLQILTPVHLPADVLQEQVFEKISLNARGITLASMISQTINNLNFAITKRNSIIQEDQRLSPRPHQLKYVTGRSGHPQDIEYATSLEAIFLYADDLIFYSKTLCQDLYKRAEELRQYIKDPSSEVRRIEILASFEYLLPDETYYQEWLSAIPKD